MGRDVQPNTSHLREASRLLLFLAAMLGAFRWTRKLSLNIPDWGSHSYGSIPKQGFSELADLHPLLFWTGVIEKRHAEESERQIGGF